MSPTAKKKPAKRLRRRPAMRVPKVAAALSLEPGPTLPAPAPAHADETAAWFVTAVFSAFYWFDGLLVVSDPWPANLRTHYLIYTAALFGVLPLALLTTLALRWMRRVLLGNNENLLPALVCVQTVFWAWIWGQPTAALMSMDLLQPIRWRLPELVLLAVAAAFASGRVRRGAWSLGQRLALLSLPPLSLILLWHFKSDALVWPQGNVVPGAMTIAFLVLIALLFSYLVAVASALPATAIGWKDWAVYAVIALLTFVAGPAPNIVHQNFYLGPVNAILGGGTLLHDVICQYGVGLIYFLVAAFKIMGLRAHYIPFAFLLMVLATGQSIVLYWITRKVYRSWLMAVLCFGAIFCLGRCSYFWQWDALMVPQTGPLRFGLPILILAAGLQRRSTGSRRWGWIELGLLGLSSIWCMETFVYSLSAWGFSEVAEAWALSGGIIDFVRRFLRSALGAAAAVCASFVALALFTLLRCGALPHWGSYIFFLTMWGGGFAQLSLQIWTSWFLLPGAVFLAILASALATFGRKDLDAGHYCMFGAAGAAAAEFSYFITEPSPNYISYIAPLYLVVFFYWLDRAWVRTAWSGVLRWTALPTAFFVLAAQVWACGPSVQGVYTNSMMAWLVSDAQALGRLPFPAFYTSMLRAPFTLSGPSVDAALGLMQRYAPDQKRIALFTPFAEEAYYLTGRIDPFPIGYYFEDNYIPGRFEKLAAEPLPLKAGDVLLIQADKAGGFSGPPDLPLENGGMGGIVLLADAVRRQFKLVPLDQQPTYGIWPVRLEPLDAPPPAPSAH